MTTFLWSIGGILYCLIGLVGVIASAMLLQSFFVLGNEGEAEEDWRSPDGSDVFRSAITFVREHPYWTSIACLFWLPLFICLVVLGVWEVFWDWHVSRHSMPQNESARRRNRRAA